MNNKKNKFLYNSFTAYLRAIYASPVGSKRETGFMVEMVINIISFVILLCVVGNFESNIDSLITGVDYVTTSAEAGAVLYGIWLLLGITRRAKPSPMGLLPISWKRRVMYDYLGNLVYTLFVMAVMMVAVLLWVLILGLIILSATGEWIFTIEETTTTITVYAPVEGQLFSLFAGLFIYGAGACLTHLRDKKLRIGLTIAFPFIVELLGLLFLNCANGGDFLMGGNISLIFNQLPVSWLWLTVTILAAVGITAFSVFLCIKYEKPNKI